MQHTVKDIFHLSVQKYPIWCKNENLPKHKKPDVTYSLMQIKALLVSDSIQNLGDRWLVKSLLVFGTSTWCCQMAKGSNKSQNWTWIKARRIRNLGFSLSVLFLKLSVIFCQ